MKIGGYWPGLLDRSNNSFGSNLLFFRRWYEWQKTRRALRARRV